MTTEELKQAIEKQTGIPAALIAADTAEDIIDQARSILAYRQDLERQREKTTREQFAEWARDLSGMEEPDTASAALDDIAETVRVDAGGYPRVRDGSISIDGMPDPRPAREQFASWFKDRTAFNPFQAHEGDW